MKHLLFLVLLPLVIGCKQPQVDNQVNAATEIDLKAESDRLTVEPDHIVITLPELNEEYCSNPENRWDMYRWDSEVQRCYCSISFNDDEIRVYFKDKAYAIDRKLTAKMMVKK